MTPGTEALPEAVKAAGRRVLWSWLVASGIVACALAVLVLSAGPRGILRVMGLGDGTAHAFRFLIFVIAWCWVTLILLLSQFPSLVRRHLLFLVVLTLLGFRYLDQVREPHAAELGDFPVYYQAAVKISRDEPIQGREVAQRTVGSDLQPGQLYIYPPLLATALSPFVFLSQDALGDAFHLANYAAVVLLVLLLYLILPRYGFSREMAAVCILLMLAVNVPLGRTLIYHQVNLYVLDLMLLGLFFFPRWLFLSALSVSLAMHLKVYPALLVIPFVFARQWRWLGWFAVSQGLIVGATSLIADPSYYFDFVRQISSLSETGLRNTSINVFYYNSFRIFGLEQATAQALLSHGTRLALLVAFTVAFVRLVRRGRLAHASPVESVVLSGYVLVPLAMLLISPSVWEHHYVLIIPTVAVVATLLRTAGQIWAFALSYIFIFLLPVVELYPISYLPLVAVVLMVGLLHVIARRTPQAASTWLSNGFGLTPATGALPDPAGQPR